MKRPVIGLIPLYDEKKASYWMLPEYMTGLEAAGAIPVMLPLTAEQELIDQLVGQLDGVLLTGGHDVDPTLYGEERITECGDPCPQRDRMETMVVEACLKADLPMFGICRGLQLLNAVSGGTLYQDLPTQRPDASGHQMTPPYDRAVHEVMVKKESPLYRILQKERLAVNSYHHQAIKILAPVLEEMAVSDDGLIEAVYHPGQTFAVAVQWHPEFFYQADEDCRKLFEAFVAACRKK